MCVRAGLLSLCVTPSRSRSVYAGAMDGSLVVMSYKYADAVRVEEGSTGPRPLVSSKVQAINDLMERMTRNVIRFIQSNRGVRVTKLIAEFCHDDNGRLWLCSISELLTVPLPKPVQNSGKPTRKESFTANAHHDSALDATGMLSITSSERPMSPGKVYKPTRRTTSVFEPSADTPLDTLPPAFQSALQRCVETFTVLTVNDVLEFRTFTNPPPAVALVSCALTLLITGEALEWRDARRAMSNGDKMFAAMAAVRADAIPRRRLDALLLLVDNPAFGQEYVRPVNAAAARIADWISSVVKFACLSRGISTKESSRCVV